MGYCVPNRVRFAWELAADGQPPLVAGVDFGVLAPDGRLRTITGFLDRVPTGAAGH